MRTRRLRFVTAFVIVGLASWLLLVVITAPGVTQVPAAGAPPGYATPSTVASPVQVHVHNYPHPTEWSYGFNPYGPRFDPVTEYRRQQLENFYNYARGNMAQLSRMQSEDVGIPSPRENQLPSDRVEQLNKVLAPGRLTDEELNRATGKIRWPFFLQKPGYAPYREKLDGLFQTWATSPKSGYGSDNYHRIQVAATALYDQIDINLKSEAPFQVKPYIYAEMFVRQLAYEAGFRPQSE
jgi:hypothetical protein